MTKETESHKEELIKIVSTMRDVKPDNKDFVKALQNLALKVGASPVSSVMTSSGARWDWATAPELVHNIHQALQTASMIDACRTAEENVKIAERSQQTASKAQQAAFWSMVAAFGAVVVNIVVAYIMAATT